VIVAALTSQQAKAVEYLRSPRTIRAHCQQIGQWAEQGRLRHFIYHPEKLAHAVEYVVAEIVRNYPNGGIPIHGRLRHLAVGGVERVELLRNRLQQLGEEEVAKTLFELVVISSLLDGGAGSNWHYVDALSCKTWNRSEGLAVASFNMFMAGGFSRKEALPLRVDGSALCLLKTEHLAAGMQVAGANQLLGLTERGQLLRHLGQQVVGGGRYFPKGVHGRLGDLFSYMVKEGVHVGPGGGRRISAEFILTTLLDAFAEIWPHGLQRAGVNMGDIGRYEGVRGEYECDGLVPFHKLSQWLTYSLLELFPPLEITVVDMEQLTGLPEYRNGGLLLDLQVLTLKDMAAVSKEHLPQSELVVEWRALTVYLLDKIAADVRTFMGKRSEEMPLATILQGGTWSAGRRIAKKLRSEGGSPLLIRSDGTIF
jgi:hypothetical protein